MASLAWWLGLSWLAAAWGGPALAAGPACSVTADLAFGAVDTTSATAMTATGNARVDCTGGAANTAYTVCVGPIGRPLTMSGAGLDPVAFDLFTDAARSIRFASASPSTLQVTTGPGGDGSASSPVYAQITTVRGQILAGAYSAAVTVAANPAACTGGIVATGTLGASAQVIERCSLAVTTHLDFGVIDPGTARVSGQGVLSVTCTRDIVPYRIGLGDGLAFANGTRAMRGLGGLLPYGLFQDSSFTRPWGSDAMSDVAATGTAAAQRFVVHGLVVMPTPPPPPGQYRDEVIVTVTY